MTYRVTERRLLANRLSHHVIEWRPPGQSLGTVVLCHGYLDMAWSWRWVAEACAEKGYAVAAFDWRGHGETDWIGAGGYYHFPDYVLDLAELLPQLSDSPPHLVGHSMGGTACALFAGARADGVCSLTLIEGLGPPAVDPATTVQRYRSFLADVARVRDKPAKVIESRQGALRRMRLRNPELDEAKGEFLAEKATREVPGGYAFRFDPLHRTTSPTPFSLAGFESFLDAVDVPTLLVFGDHGYRLADEQTRVDRLRGSCAVKTLHGGHMLHWFAPTPLADCLTHFFEGLRLQ